MGLGFHFGDLQGFPHLNKKYQENQEFPLQKKE